MPTWALAPRRGGLESQGIAAYHEEHCWMPFVQMAGDPHSLYCFKKLYAVGSICPKGCQKRNKKIPEFGPDEQGIKKKKENQLFWQKSHNPAIDKRLDSVSSRTRVNQSNASATCTVTGMLSSRTWTQDATQNPQDLYQRKKGGTHNKEIVSTLWSCLMNFLWISHNKIMRQRERGSTDIILPAFEGLLCTLSEIPIASYGKRN